MKKLLSLALACLLLFSLSAEPAAEASAPDAASDDAQNEMVGNAAEKES